MNISVFLVASRFCFLFSQILAENGIRATQGITEGFHVALTLAKLFNYELRKHSIPRAVSIDMITAIGSYIDPMKQNIPEKYRSLLNDTDFLGWQKRIEKVSSNFRIHPNCRRKRVSVLSIYWCCVLQKLNKKSSQGHFAEANNLDTDAFMMLNNAMKPYYPTILGNVQILEHAHYAPLDPWEFENILESIKNIKDMIKNGTSDTNITNDSASKLLEFAVYSIDLLETEIKSVVKLNNFPNNASSI